MVMAELELVQKLQAGLLRALCAPRTQGVLLLTGQEDSVPLRELRVRVPRREARSGDTGHLEHPAAPGEGVTGNKEGCPLE